MNRLHFGIAVVIVTLGRIGCSPASSTQAEMTKTNFSSQESEYTLIDGKCDSGDCLFIEEADQDVLIGIATVSGYYAQLERSAFEHTKQCDSFVITKAAPSLTQFLLSMIEHGNTVYIKNDLNQPIISLELNMLTEPEKQRLVSSSISQPVSVVLLATSSSPQGAPVCFSQFEILRVK